MPRTDVPFIPGPPTREMVEKARETAEQFAAEQGVSIDQVCVAMSLQGDTHAFVLDDDEDDEGDDDE